MSQPQHHIALPWVPTLPHPAHSARTHAWSYEARGLPGDVLTEAVVPTPMLPPPVELAKAVGLAEPWLLVAVEYAALNPGAIFQMTLVPPAMRQRRAVPEMDFAGEVLDAWSPDENAEAAARGQAEWMTKAPEAPPSPKPYPPSTAAEAKAVAMAATANPASVPDHFALDPHEPVNPPKRGGGSKSSSSSSSSSDDDKAKAKDKTTKDKSKAESKTGSAWQRGDRVAGMLPADFALPSGTGALQAIIAVPARYCVRLPLHVDSKQAAGVLLAGMTADAMVRQSGILDFDPAAHPLEAKNGAPAPAPAAKNTSNVDCAKDAAEAEESQPLLALAGGGESSAANGAGTRPIRVLVNAAAGGIGHLLLQMLKTLPRRAHVTAVCSAKNFELVRALGADDVVDYSIYADLAGHLGAACAPFDFAFDALGVQPLYKGCAAFLAPHGVFESVGVRPPSFGFLDFLRAVVAMKANEYWPTARVLWGTGRVYKGVSMMKPSTEDRQRVVDMLAQGRIKVVVDSTWDWEHARAAYGHLAQGHAAGKVIVKVNPKAY